MNTDSGSQCQVSTAALLAMFYKTPKCRAYVCRMNPFLKAALLTIVVVALALALAAQLDSMRATELRSNIESSLFVNQENAVALHYSRVMANEITRMKSAIFVA